MNPTLSYLDELLRRMHQSRDWNVPGPADLAARAAMTAAPPNAVAIEALRHMRDTTQSREQYARAVAALKQMGVRDE